MIWLIILGCLYAGLHAIRLRLAWRHLHFQPADQPVPATILQPILSGDPDLSGSLSKNLQNAPESRFIWLVDTDDDAARQIAARLQTSSVRIECIDPPGDGENPKLKKLIHGQPSSGVIVVLDDDTILSPQGAARLAGRAAATGGLATAIPIWGRPPRNMAETLVAGFINGQGASSYFAISALGKNRTINGMAYAIPAETLMQLGGFTAAGHEVTDDWAVARLARNGGVPLIQTAEPAEVAVSLQTLGAGFVLLRRWMLFAHRYLSANSDLASFSLVVLPGLLPLVGLVLACVLWPPLGLVWLTMLSLRSILHARLIGRVGGANIPRTLIGSVVAELMLPLLSLSAFWRPRHLKWRSRQMQLDESGRIRFR